MAADTHGHLTVSCSEAQVLRINAMVDAEIARRAMVGAR